MATLENPFDKVRPKMVAARIEFMGQLATFSNDEIAREPGEDEWSPLQLAHHLYIADGLALEQMQLVQNEDNPLVANVGEEAPRRTRSSEPPASLDAVLAGMAARREELFEYLASLPADAWERPFRHQDWGQLKFYQLVNVLPAHDQLHAQQLTDIKAKYS
jgi:DinB superfamily